ncbi:MAG: DNA methyltransferase, partial [Polaromonas sp.]
PLEAAWPKANVVIGNPPFLGGSKKRRELGDAYFEALALVFKDRVPAGADLVCYWFDKARMQMAGAGLQAAGFVATQSVRSGSNRRVLDAIVKDVQIFDAWADEPWVNEGAAVRVSLVCFGLGENGGVLNGKPVKRISADLGGDGGGVDLTTARLLPQNAGASFEGTKKYGDFDISGELARSWLCLPNPHGKSNAEVVKPWRNGQDLSQRHSDTWIVDFGTSMTDSDAGLYEAPFSYIALHVKPERIKVRRERTKRIWWLHEEARVALRKALRGLPRFMATPRVSKHRFFVFLDATVLPDTRLNVIARADDTTFGLLSSRIHEVWSLAQASMHGVGNDPTYNAKSCFETFPFPEGLTPADTAHQRTEAVEGGALIPADISVPSKARTQKARAQAAIQTIATRDHAMRIAIAAKRLNDLRESWLNPPEWTQRLPEVIPLGMDKSPYPDRIVPRPGHEKELAERTLTKLYNQRPAWLDAAHKTLDAAVAAAYGWADYSADLPDEEILKRLLALNLARAASATGA